MIMPFYGTYLTLEAAHKEERPLQLGKVRLIQPVGLAQITDAPFLKISISFSNYSAFTINSLFAYRLRGLERCGKCSRRVFLDDTASLWVGKNISININKQ